MHLIPLIKSKLLTKTPAQNFLQLDDKLSVNMDYRSPSLRNRINVLASKIEKANDGSKI